jgi:hypothetical protein
MASFEERSVGELSIDVVERLKRTASDRIEDFSVCFVLGDKLAGSGTFVDAFGDLGILTAFHVADELMRESDRDLSLIIANHPHRFELPRDCVEHIPLGKPDKTRPEDGPDLSFIRIVGQTQLSTIKSKKSFYLLAGRPFSDLDGVPLEKLFWWLSGVPASSSKPMTSKTREGALVAKFLIADVEFIEHTKKDAGHDILTLAISCSPPPFARNYKGCSGGGIWVATLTKLHPGAGDETLDVDACRLAGVAYYQGDLTDGRRMIFANGPGSILKLRSVKGAC